MSMSVIMNDGLIITEDENNLLQLQLDSGVVKHTDESDPDHIYITYYSPNQWARFYRIEKKSDFWD